MSDLILKKGKEKSLLRRHPWVYDTAVERVVGKPMAFARRAFSRLGCVFAGFHAEGALLVLLRGRSH